MSLLISLVLGTALAAVALSSASAHGIWIAERAGKQAIIYGHGAEDDAYKTDKLKSLTALDTSGKPQELAVKDLDDHVAFIPAEDTALVTAIFDNGYWTKDTDGKWTNKPKNEVANAVSGGHYVKYATAVLSADADTLTPKGLPLEIITAVNPLTLHAGDKLPVLVLHNGKPAVGAKLIGEYTTDSENSVKTDDNGEAVITIRNNGLNVIAATLDEPLTGDDKADEIGHFTTFSFAFGHSH